MSSSLCWNDLPAEIEMEILNYLIPSGITLNLQIYYEQDSCQTTEERNDQAKSRILIEDTFLDQNNLRRAILGENCVIKCQQEARLQPGLLLVCKSWTEHFIHNLYKTNAFRFQTRKIGKDERFEYVAQKVIRNFMQRLSQDNRRLIRQLVLQPARSQMDEVSFFLWDNTVKFIIALLSLLPELDTLRLEEFGKCFCGDIFCSSIEDISLYYGWDQFTWLDLIVNLRENSSYVKHGRVYCSKICSQTTITLSDKNYVPASGEILIDTKRMSH